MRIAKRKSLPETEDSKTSWKRVHTAEQQHVLGLEGFISLDTLDDAQIIRADDSAKDDALAKIVAFPKRKKHSKKSPGKQLQTVLDKPGSVDPRERSPCETLPTEDTKEDVSSADSTPWRQFGLSSPLVKAIQSLGFEKPTPIQQGALIHGLQYRRDIIGCAETGSGKTLAFGLPIIQGILDLKNASKTTLIALIIAPTRELALQIVNELKTVSVHTPIKIVALVGGLAKPKQDRLLKGAPEIVVATPGRLFEILSEEDGFLNDFSGVRYFVLDEADRMIENGHFKELDFIISKLPSKETLRAQSGVRRRQTFVFSATMLVDTKFKKSTSTQKKETDLESLMRRIEFHDDKPKIIDLSPKGLLASNIVEFRLRCTDETKEVYLCYFLHLHPGKSIVFLNSIDQIRRLAPLLRLLGIEAQVLHSELKQFQRLRNLDRFRDHPAGILLASDVAARGLHIPDVQHVVHFQVPRTVETYIHRSGRAGRVSEHGVSFLLIGPKELITYKKLCKLLGKGDIADFPVDVAQTREIEKRIKLAQRIDEHEHHIQKRNYNEGWLNKMAKDMDIEIDDDSLLGSSRKHEDEDTNSSEMEQSRLKKHLFQWKAELGRLLARPLPKSASPMSS